MQLAPGGEVNATKLGMAIIGCISEDGRAKCQYAGKCKDTSATLRCVSRSLQEHPEAASEILLAGLAVASWGTRSIIPIKSLIPKFEMSVANAF